MGPNTRTFLHVLVNTAVAGLTTNFLWFAVVFWVYLETRSILATGVLSGTFMILIAACSMWFGSLVDRMRKQRVMLLSAWATLAAFILGCVIYFSVPSEQLLRFDGPWFWVFSLIVLAGCVVELLRSLALSTTVTLLVPAERHANANGLVGTVQGLAFIATSVFSGLSVGMLGMGATIVIATVCVAVPLVHLHLLRIPEPVVARDPGRSAVDFRGGMAALLAVPGLLALVIFSTFNNLASGAFMALTDPYGLTMFPVEVWGLVFGLASTGFVIGGLTVAKLGLGRNPIRTMLILVGVIGLVSVLFTIREWPWLFILGIWVFMMLMPAVEAAEQTVIQRVVPFEKQGRVFGLAMTFEAAAAPITALLIAPTAEFWIVPYLGSPEGQREWGWLLGEGESRGIGFIFVWTGIAMIVLAGGAALTRSYRTLSRSYAAASPSAAGGAAGDSAPAG
ncbi:DHA3 family multidrug efflux protein-like MFS transporter [Leucobacter luti]|uniref:DHA3 family multidrug efflux protein-like MFS transporter n=2 Tax=Leucobacter luti TaxID=340320 RepID=A0A4Q7TLC8_9MICO|nr:MFS transporter [Leucobacter luti]MBL3700136.1 MFS transporter [Leucobacter luti]RZT61143.1 DHA3 family multidrug efflux protein-like MFS transporter [Leucobacter luti]